MIPGLPLTGRVVSPTGQPLPHVPVYVMTKSAVTISDTINHIPASTIQSNGQTVITDDHGVYTAQGVRPGDTVSILVNKPGYRYISGGTVSSAFDGYKADDLVVAPPVAMIGGKVVDSSGAPVPAATVIAPIANVELQAITDPTGHFVLEGLPSGATDLFAVTKTQYGRLNAPTGSGEVDIKLSPVTLPDAADVARGTALLTDLSKTTAGGSYKDHDSIPFELAPYDIDSAVALASQGTPPADAVLLGIITNATFGDPEKAAPIVTGLLDKIVDPGQKALAASVFGLALTRSRSPLASPLLDKAKQWARQSPIDRYGGGERIAVASLAARLNDRDAGRMVDDTIKAMIDGAHNANKGNTAGANDVIEQFLGVYAELVAPAGIAYVDRVINHLPSADPSSAHSLPRIMPLCRAIAAMAPYDAREAAQLLNRSLSAGVTTGMPIYGQAAVAVIEQLAGTDPAAALALAKTVIDQEHKPIALALAANGLAGDQATPVWRDALTAALTCRNRSALAGWVCSMAFQRDHALGEMLFAMGWRSLAQQVALPGGQSAFMYFYAQVDPGQARLTIEKEYASALLTLRATDDDSRMLGPSLAMSAIDIDRAIEMAKGIEGVSREPVIRKIGEFVMLSPQRKRTIRFDRWMSPDDWTPGSPVER